MKNLKAILLSSLVAFIAIAVGCGGGNTTFTKLPFASDRTPSSTSLFVMNLDGTNVTAVTNVPANDFWSPSISANHKKVTFLSAGNVWLINADGTGKTQLTTYMDDSSDNYSTAYYAQIAPNAKTVLYGARDNNGVYSMWSMNVDGTGKTNLTATLPTGMLGCFEGSFSANSKKIAFACYNNTSYGIYVADADGSHQDVVIPSSSGVYAYLPMFSPDGKKILFYGSNVGGDIRSNFESSHPRAHLAVTPHGNSGNWGIYSSNLDGSGIVLVLPNVYEAEIFNSSLYYTLYDSDISKNQLWKSNVDGTSAVKISDGTANDYLYLNGD
ncbi:MAG TPA: hypothetical protein VLK33_13810 [Terriglobales bacterium]|nr:hypothetical protein [Terriglobales bacterium]